MNRLIALKSLCLPLLAVPAFLLAQTALEPTTLNKPTAIPDRIVLSWSQDPAATQSVTWRTDTTVAEAWGEISLSGEGPTFVNRTSLIKAQSEKITTDLGDAHYHSATFADLSSNTQYVYRVGDGLNWSPWHQFRTAAGSTAEPLEFLFFGDIQEGIEPHWSRLVQTAAAQAPKARLALYAGDLINNWNRDAEWGEFHRAGAPLHHTMSALPTPGNHEYGDTLSPNWRAQFTLPLNGAPGQEETVYSLDVQGVRFISLNSMTMNAEQAKWFENVLAKNPNRWTVTMFHYPVFSSAKSRLNSELSTDVQPIIDKYAVDLVLTGHDHTYARSGIVRSGHTTNPRAGTVYVTSVSGSKMYEIEPRPWMLRKAEDTQFFSVVRIDGDELAFETRTPTGTLYDRFMIRKRAGQANEIINDIPASPERLRATGNVY